LITKNTKVKRSRRMRKKEFKGWVEGQEVEWTLGEEALVSGEVVRVTPHYAQNYKGRGGALWGSGWM
jgi:hypothetical protein